MGTTLSDIIVPELFNPYVIQKTLEKSALVQSGIVQNDAEFDKLASQASPLVNMPFFSDLTGESETDNEGDDLTADKISRKKSLSFPRNFNFANAKPAVQLVNNVRSTPDIATNTLLKK